jgi:hypothetical protein
MTPAKILSWNWFSIFLTCPIQSVKQVLWAVLLVKQALYHWATSPASVDSTLKTDPEVATAYLFPALASDHILSPWTDNCNNLNTFLLFLQPSCSFPSTENKIPNSKLLNDLAPSCFSSMHFLPIPLAHLLIPTCLLFQEYQMHSWLLSALPPNSDMLCSSLFSSFHWNVIPLEGLILTLPLKRLSSLPYPGHVLLTCIPCNI